MKTYTIKMYNPNLNTRSLVDLDFLSDAEADAYAAKLQRAEARQGRRIIVRVQ